jgi:hypothetical protein
MWDWLATPLSGAPDHAIAPWAMWHARVMVLAWGVLLPLGGLLARYFKVTARQRWPQELDNKGWWRGHLALQWSGMALMGVGLLLAWGNSSGASAVARWHAWAGWGVATLGGLQLLSGLLRGSKGGPTDTSMRGDHYDMSAHRRRFEWLHKSMGWLAVLGSIAVICMGLLAADAPRWMMLSLWAWWLGLFAVGWHLQQSGRCVDTYQAIWGPDPAHPGNRLRPIGWGIRRRSWSAGIHNEVH